MLALLLGLLAVAGTPSQNSVPLPPAVSPSQPAPAAVERLGPTTYRVGSMRIDTARRELTVPAVLNDVPVIEFVATMTGGVKGYESAMTVETDAISFNAALMLLGLDPSRGRPSARQFDTAIPQGDPVELTVSWTMNGENHRVPIEELLYDKRSGNSLRPEGPWVYTGSTFVDAGNGRQFLAQLDGVLIGLMHGPSAIIENPRSDTVGGFGAIVPNPNLGVLVGMPVTLSVRALPRGGTR